MTQGDVPPDRQCTLPSCNREATDPTDPTPVCETHLAAVSGNDSESDRDDAGEEYDHENPIDVSDITADERADLLREYLKAFVAEFDRTPRLMPLDEEGKAPVIQGRCRLDSPEGREYLVDGEEAIRQIRDEGARGFAIYAGKRDHGTHGVAFVDHDDDSFPAPTGDPTLEVLSGSGRGAHETYRNDPEDPVANARVGDNVGEIRAENWYVVAPGSVHPTGGVYHVAEHSEVATLSDSDLEDSMRPSTGRSDKDVHDDATAYDKDGEGELPDSDEVAARLEAAFNNSHDGERIEQAYNGRYAAAGFSDRSGAEYWLANRLDSWVGLGSETTVRRVMDRGNLQKWEERTDRSYRDSILADVGRQDWYFDPEGDGNGDADDTAYGKESIAMLPETPDLATAASGWDWRTSAGRDHAGDDPLQDARDRATAKIADAIGTGNRVLIEALPTLGKSYGAVKAAAETGEPVTILTTRGNKEQYGQLEEWCKEFGLTYARLPAFTRHCETARGDHGEGWQRTVMDWYNRGATPKEIHALAEQTHGSGLPCQHDGQCDLAAAWDAVEPEETDVLIGHYTHAYKPDVVTGRTVMFDEFAEEAFEQRLDHGIEGAISYFLQQHDPIPFEDYADLLEHRDDKERRAEALAFLAEYGTDADPHAVIANEAGHAGAPAAVLTILGGEDLGNGWERTRFPDDDRVGLFDRETGAVSILRPPALDYASSVIALDGTPTKKLWELTLGERLNHIQILTDAEREEYLADALNLNLVRTTDAIKPYNNPDHVATDQDAALLEAIAEQHGTEPGLITSRRALGVYQDAGVLEYDPESGDVVDGPADRTAWYGDVLGSNRFDDTRVGAVIGSNHYGDRYIEKWGAYAGEAVERGEGKGADLTYGRFGDKVLRHMREHDTLQAAMRFGRDGNGAVVYIHTDTLPDWVPLAGEGRVIVTWSKGMRQVIDVANDLEEWTTAEIAAHPDVEIGERQVRNVLASLAERDVVDRETDGCGFVWRDTGLHRLNDHGDVELDPVAVDDLTDEESAELARSSNYTWNFRTLRRSTGDDSLGEGEPAGSLGARSATTADPDEPPPG